MQYRDQVGGQKKEEVKPVEVEGVEEWEVEKILNKRKVRGVVKYTAGAILFQEFKADSKWHLVALFSKSLSLVKCNYKIYDKNMLAISILLKNSGILLKEQQTL